MIWDFFQKNFWKFFKARKIFPPTWIWEIRQFSIEREKIVFSLQTKQDLGQRSRKCGWNRTRIYSKVASPLNKSASSINTRNGPRAYRAHENLSFPSVLNVKNRRPFPRAMCFWHFPFFCERLSKIPQNVFPTIIFIPVTEMVLLLCRCNHNCLLFCYIQCGGKANKNGV